MQKKIVSLLIALALLIAPVVAEGYAAIDGKIINVSKYGNITIDVLVSDAMAEGYATGDIVTLTAGAWSSPAPIGTSYSDVDSGSPIVRFSGEYIEAAINYGNFAKVSGTEVGSPVSIMMLEKEGYADEYIIRHLTRTENRDDYASDEVFANFRPVKAGNIRENWLYRSCNPMLGDARAPYADALAEEAGIRTAVNLADKEDALATAGGYYGTLVESGSVIALNLGVDFFSDSFTEGLNKGFKFIIANEGPYLVHCNEGKDRAGLTSALLEALSGATEEEIISDYMQSFANYYGTEPGTRQYEAISKVITDFLTKLGAGGDTTIQEAAENYIIGKIGLTQAETNALKESLT